MSDGFSVKSKSNTTLNIHYNVSGITLEDSDREGLEGQFITLTGIHIANEAGAPDLPSNSAFVAIPNGSMVSFKMVNTKTKILKDVDLIPAPQPQLDNDNSPAVYQKDMSIYGKNAFYPETPYQVSEVMTVRGVEMVQVGVMPFQYNPVTKELVVYESMELEMNAEGGDGNYGDVRYRTPEWDHILTDMLLNRDVLPPVDFGEKLRKHYENRETGCEYLIITPDNEEFIQLADSVRRFRIAQGIPTEIVTVTECGGNTHQAIKSFIRNAYNHWDMPPAAVLILGDHDSDPTQGVVSYTMNNHPGGGGYNPYISDHAYSVMGNNDMPDIILGRITGRNYDELYHMIKKDLDYERTPPTNPDFYDHPITAMGFQLERWFQLCSEVVNGFWEYGLEKHPVRMNAIYQGTPGSRWSTYEHTNAAVNYFGPTGCGYIPSNMSHLTDWSANATKVNEAINSGAFILQHRDHGAEELWGEPSYSVGNIKRLVNPDLTYVMSNNCLTGRFNFGGSDGCFAEVFHRHQYGALGLIAATQVSYSFVNDVYVWGLYDNLWPDFMPTYGTVHPTSSLLPAFGNAAGKYFLRQSSWADGGVKEITYYLFHQHGDAYMNLYSEVPQPLAVEMLPVVVAGSDTYQIKVEEGAAICLTVDDQIIGFDYGTGDEQLITIIPQEAGTIATLTITKQNHYRYHHRLMTIPNEGPYLIFNNLKINDPEGNDNGYADYDEICQLGVSLHNVGFADLNQPQVTLSCLDPEVQVTQSQASFESIPAQSTLMKEDAFTVHFGDAIPDGEMIRFYLDIVSGQQVFRDSLEITVNAPVFHHSKPSFTDLEGNPVDRLNRGESSLVSFDLQNIGHSKSLEIANTLRIKAPFLSIEETSITMPALESQESSRVTYRVDVLDEAPDGYILPYEITAQSGQYNKLSTGELPLSYTMEDFEDEDLNPHFTWNLGSGNKKWYIVEDTTAPGGHCLRSPAMTDNKSSILYVSVKTDFDSKFIFHHKTSTEEGDKLILYINTEEVEFWSGENDWEQSEYELKAGTNLIRFSFKKDISGSGGEDCVMIDRICMPPMTELILYAGEDNEMCPEATYQPNSYACYFEELQWTSDGDGSFDDETSEQPVYTFGNDDLAKGSVNLTMTAKSILDNTTASSSVIVNLKEDITDLTPTAPIGDTLIDFLFANQSEYAADSSVYDFIWTLEPAEAGQMEADDNHAMVIWSETYRGIAQLSYQLQSECGVSESSEPISVRLMNSTHVMETSSSPVEVFPNPAKDQVTIRANQLADGKAMLNIVAVDGRTVYATEVDCKNGYFEHRLSTTDYPKGVYTVRIIVANGCENALFVIQ